MSMDVCLTANAGVIVKFHGLRIWIDAVHEKGEAGFSAINPILWEQVKTIAKEEPPHMLLFTHCHDDHFSADMARAIQEIAPEAPLVCPQEMPGNSIRLQGEKMVFRLGETEILFRKMPHEGEQFAHVANYVICISDSQDSYLFAADGKIAADELADLLKEEPVKAAFLDFPWYTLRRGRDFISTYLSSAEKILYHLPFEEDDFYGYRRNVEGLVMRKPYDRSVHLLWEPFQTLTI